MKFKDVAHLYLGCEGELTVKRTYDPPKCTIEKLSYGLLCSVMTNTTVLSFKPFLYPLSSMTDDGDNTDEEILEEICDAIGVEPHLYYQAYGNILIGLADGNWEGLTIGYMEMALIVKILCSHSMDLFGLIECNEAIDATKHE